MKKRVMVVDDSRFIYEEMRQMLADTDFEIVSYCKTGEESLKAYGEFTPDVVTMDIILPGIDGLETTKLLLAQWPLAKVIVVSSLAYDETMDSARDFGTAGFIFKPFEKKQLQEALSKATSDL